MVTRQIKEQADSAAGASAECMAALNGLARSVRRSMLLAQKFTSPAPKEEDPAQRRGAAREQIVRKVDDAIHRDASEDQEENLKAELRERLDAPEFDDELDRRPVAEIIDEISGDLGAYGDIGQQFWKRRTPQDIAALKAQAAGRHPAGLAES